MGVRVGWLEWPVDGEGKEEAEEARGGGEGAVHWGWSGGASLARSREVKASSG